MLFYFTGTGNSLYAAKALADKGEAVVDMAEQRNTGNYRFKIEKGEAVGFVFPAYFYSVPDVVAEFCGKLRLSGENYVYAVITCGAGIGGSGGLLKEILAKRNIILKNVFPVVMPDNAMIFYSIPDAGKNDGILAQSDKRLRLIKKQVRARKKRDISGSAIGKLGRTAYHLMNKTKKFYADNSCVGCGLCVKNCPEKAIEMKNGRPHWIKPTCSKCTACINRCPSKAIQYGKATIKRCRYVNPILKSS